MTTHSAPEDPEYSSELKALSPVSPKPMHFPLPSNIPVLEKQMDQAFNQTAAHMVEPTGEQASVLAIHSGPPPIEQGIIVSETTMPVTDGDVEMSGHGINDEKTAELQTAHAQMDSEMNYDPTALAQVEVDDEEDHGAQDISEASNDSLVPPNPAAHEPSSATDLPSQGLDASQIASSTAHLNGVSANASPSQDTDSDVNYQALLDSLSSAPPTALAEITDDQVVPSYEDQPSTAAVTTGSPSTTVGAPPAGLPPRPPPQAQPSIHPNYTQSTNIGDYHPHALNPAVQPQAQQANFFPNATPSHLLPPPFQTAAPGANGLPPPPVASFQQQPILAMPTQIPSPATQKFLLESQREIKQAAGESLADEDAPWNMDLQRKYDQFLEEERGYVTEGKWEQFPHGSRLFVGNLSSEKVTKRDMFHVFHTYGKLAQISIKQAYGFVQFLEVKACDRALHTEEGRSIRGKKIHLEISKPQKNSRHNETKRRSRSPDRARGGQAPAGVDRYVSGQGGGRRTDRRRDNGRGRDDYRPRSPSPAGYRIRERYDRPRSRSRSPYGRGSRYRSPSPRRDTDDDLPLPRRAPRDVPDVQMIVLDELDRNFISWVERAFTSRGVRIDVLLLSPRLSEAAVVKRQIIEGVAAVSRLTRANQQTAKIPLQVFDRRGGAEVRFEEYVDLDPAVAVEVVLRAKANNAAPPPAYGYGYGTSAPAPPPPNVVPPNLGNIISSLDASGLQKLLGVMQPPGAPPLGHQPQTALTPELAKLLGGGGVPMPPPGYGQTSTLDPLAALRSNPALAGLLGGQVAPPTPTSQTAVQSTQPEQQGQPDMADILARLGSYRR